MKSFAPLLLLAAALEGGWVAKSDDGIVVFTADPVLHLPRVHGSIPKRTCKVHREVMSVELVPISRGLLTSRPVSDDIREHIDELETGMTPADLLPVLHGRLLNISGVVTHEYEDARASKFPNVPTFVQGGCASIEEEAEVYVCLQCRKERAAWLAAHPGFEPPGTPPE